MDAEIEWKRNTKKFLIWLPLHKHAYTRTSTFTNAIRAYAAYAINRNEYSRLSVHTHTHTHARIHSFARTRTQLLCRFTQLTELMMRTCSIKQRLKIYYTRPYAFARVCVPVCVSVYWCVQRPHIKEYQTKQASSNSVIRNGRSSHAYHTRAAHSTINPVARESSDWERGNEWMLHTTAQAMAIYRRRHSSTLCDKPFVRSFTTWCMSLML